MSSEQPPWVNHSNVRAYKKVYDQEWSVAKEYLLELPPWLSKQVIESWEQNAEQIIYEHALGLSLLPALGEYPQGFLGVLETAVGGRTLLFEQLVLLPGFGRNRALRLLGPPRFAFWRWPQIVQLVREKPASVFNFRALDKTLRRTPQAQFTHENVRTLREWVLSGQPDLRINVLSSGHE